MKELTFDQNASESCCVRVLRLLDKPTIELLHRDTSHEAAVTSCLNLPKLKMMGIHDEDEGSCEFHNDGSAAATKGTSKSFRKRLIKGLKNAFRVS